MPSSFRAEVYQNPYLAKGSDEVHAIMTVTAADIAVTAAPKERLFGIICDVSGSMEGGKIIAAKNAIAQIVNALKEDTAFFIVVGSADARAICPVAFATPDAKAHAMVAMRSVRADGATFISNWLKEALGQFKLAPGALKQALLLTDGQNDEQDTDNLKAVLAQCEGVFQCDCRGVGTDWKVDQLRYISTRLLGTTDIIPQPQQIEADFRAILDKALNKNLSDVVLRLWTPIGANIKFCKEVSPQIIDLTARSRMVKPQVRDYPTGAWGKNETRDFHFCIQVRAGEIGDEVLAGRASLVYTENGAEQKAAEARILAVWTDDEARSAKIDRVVAHYTGQAELAQAIQDGLDARSRGKQDDATALLGKAVRLAHETGNDATAKLLRNVVDVYDAPTGTVRLKKNVAKEDEMALDTRSTKTTRLQKSTT